MGLIQVLAQREPRNRAVPMAQEPSTQLLRSGTHTPCLHCQTCRWVCLHAHPSCLLPASTAEVPLPSPDPHLRRHPFNPLAPYLLCPQPGSWRLDNSLFQGQLLPRPGLPFTAKSLNQGCLHKHFSLPHLPPPSVWLQPLQAPGAGLSQPPLTFLLLNLVDAFNSTSHMVCGQEPRLQTTSSS